MKLWFLIVFCLTLFSCSEPKLTETTILGRWVEQAENLKIEFTANHLYAKRKPNTPVEVGLWSIKDEELLMRSLTGPEVTAWRPRMEDDGFIIDKTKAQFRTFKKLKLPGTPVDPKMVGLWRSYGDHPQFVEFTEQGTFVGVFCRLDKPGGQVYNVGCLADVLTAGRSKFYLQGYMGAKRMIKGVNPHPYRIEGEKLIWGRKHKTKKKVTYRRISSFDLEEMAAKGTPGSTPSGSPSPAPSPSNVSGSTDS